MPTLAVDNGTSATRMATHQGTIEDYMVGETRAGGEGTARAGGARSTSGEQTNDSGEANTEDEACMYTTTANSVPSTPERRDKRTKKQRENGTTPDRATM